MSDEKDYANNFEQVNKSRDRVIHYVFFDAVQNLFQLENSQQTQEPQESSHLHKSEQLGRFLKSISGPIILVWISEQPLVRE
jgi:hypothetical protein